MKWTDKRIGELQELRELFIALSQINHGSGFIEKIQECIKIAERLFDFDINGKNKSFLEFLFEDCIADRENPETIKLLEKQLDNTKKK